MSYFPSQTQKRNAIPFTDSVKYSFNTTWFDKVADKDREYVVTVYVDTREVEIADVARRCPFLKRSPFPELDLSRLRVGQTVLIYGRQHNIVGYANEYTRAALERPQAAVLGVVSPQAVGRDMSSVCDALQQAQAGGLTVQRMLLAEADAELASAFGGESMLDGPALFVELTGPDAHAVWGGIARESGGRFLALADADAAACARLAERAFRLRPTCAPAGAETCVLVVQPAFQPRFPEVLAALLEAAARAGLAVTGLRAHDPAAADVDELLRAYQGVLPNWRAYCDALDGGECVAAEVAGPGAVAACRALCGPFDPEIARALAPQSLRARLGADQVRNAVFVTDIPEEAEIHSDYWFRAAAE